MAGLNRMLLYIPALLLALAGGPAVSQPMGFDHFTTGFELTGAHRDLQCESCHRRGIFAGTPRECRVCHDNNGLLETSFKPTDHIPTTGSCESCHNEVDWQNITRMDHSQVPQTCSL